MRQDELKGLREQRKSLHADMLALNEQAEKDNRDLTAEENQEFSRMAEEFEELERRVQRGIKITGNALDLERERTVAFLPVGEKAPESLGEYRHRRFATEEQMTVVSPEYRAAFYHWLSSKRPDSDLEIEEWRIMNKTTTTLGGFMVPTDMYSEFLRALRFQGSVASLAKEVTTSGGENLLVPINSAHGVATWTAESAGYTLSDETLAQVSLGAHKAATIIKVTEELLEDAAFPLDSWLATEFGERIAVLEETAFVIGDGTGKPQGLLATDATANITLATAAVGNSTTFTYDALVEAVFALPEQYSDDASFIVNRLTAKNLYLLKDSQLRPLWNVNIAASGPDTFMGYPIYRHPDVPAPAISKISLLFGNWKKAYMIRRVTGMGMQRLSELYAATGEVGFRGFERVDGKVTIAAAGIALKHSAT